MNAILTKPFIPKSDDGYIENIEINLGESNKKFLRIEVPAKPKNDYEIEMWNNINNFENESWTQKKAGLNSGYENINKALDGGIKPGFYIIAADSNVGR